jgi:hypothetical protein
MESLIVVVLSLLLLYFYGLIPKSTTKPREFGKGMFIDSSVLESKKE